MVFINWKEAVVDMELEILIELGFDVSFTHPHKFILNYIRVAEGSKQMVQLSWNY